jgi:DNA primase
LSSSFRDNNDRERVLDQTDIVHLVGEHLRLHPKGAEYVGLCPFHDDHKPSMCVVPTKQIFHCFSCGAGGNAYDFVIRFHGMEFREALEFLADRAGIELTPFKPASGASPQQPQQPQNTTGYTKDELIRATGIANAFFGAIYSHAEHGKAARGIVANRSITDDMVETFGISAAPDRWDGLVSMIQSKNMDPGPFVAAGLLKQRDSGGHYDTFRNRLIFPIHDRIGRPIAFGGRIINEEDEPKYLNSPESPIFDKSATPFALKQAIPEIKRTRTAIITEGYTDAIALHQAGITNAIATLGTAFTTKHARTLRGLCDTVVLVFDADEAGLRAADRALEVLFAETLDVRIAVVPEGQDPDDMLKKEGGEEAFRAMIQAAPEALDFRFERLAKHLTGAGEAARVRVVEDQIRTFVDLGLHRVEPIRKQLIAKRLARLVGVEEKTVREAIANARPSRRSAEETAPHQIQAFTPTTGFERALSEAIGCMLSDPAIVEVYPEDARDIPARAAYALAPDSPLLLLAQALGRRIEANHEPELASILIELTNPDAIALATALALRADHASENDTERTRNNFAECVKSIRRIESRSNNNESKPTQDQDIIERIAKRAQLMEEVGGDPLAVPRTN